MYHLQKIAETNKLYLLLIALFLFSFKCFSQDSNAVIRNIEFGLFNKQLVVTYDIVDEFESKGYFIQMKVFSVNGKELIASELYGDVNKVVPKGKSKSIQWNISSDHPNLNDEVYVEIYATALYKPKLTTQLFQETVFPGITGYVQNKQKVNLLIGVSAYGTMLTSIVLEAQARKNYTNYKQELNTEDRELLYQRAVDRRNLSDQLLVAGASIWVTNYLRVMLNRYFTERKFLNSPVNLANVYITKPALSSTYCMNFTFAF